MAKEQISITLLDRYLTEEVREAQEFQSAVMRILAWILMMGLIGLAGREGIYRFDWQLYLLLFAVHLFWFVGILVHVMSRPRLIAGRTYLGSAADLSGTSFSILLSGNPISPFYILYIWSFLSQGTRFGRNNLAAASLGSVVAYSIVVSVLGGWSTHPVETGFLLLFLMILPLYQYSLLGKLHVAKQSAEAANRARGNFLATMTHELRTPLSGVIGMAGLLNNTRLSDEQKDYVESINTSAGVLHSLIGDILDLSKIDAGKLELKPVRFAIRDALVETASALGSQALEKGVEVVCHVEAAVPEVVRGDELRLRQILFNLVGNAVKFTDSGQVCIVAAVAPADQDLDRPHLRIAVSDSGVGISADKLPEIFDSFWQADSSSTRRYAGSGLGTTIARDLTRLMGGAIGVDSEEGVGTTFWIKLPLLDRGSTRVPQPPPALANRHVMVVEHNEAGACALQAALAAADMDVTHVPRIEELERGGWKSAGRPVHAVVISDSPRGEDMPGIAGRARRVLGADVPVLYLHYPKRPVPLRAGNEASASKPFRAPDLWRALVYVIEPIQTGAERGSAVTGDESETGIHVLVAEDDAINAKLITSLLRKAGHRVTLVHDGEVALHTARDGKFDIALVDLRMPRMDGIDFARAYRSREPAGEHLPIVALTANAAEEAKSECLAAGMDEFLTKPVDPQVLEGLLHSLSKTA